MAAKIASTLGLGGAGALLREHDDDVVIVSSLRTPITRARKGGFKDTLPEELLGGVLKAILSRTNISPKLIEDVQVGCVLPPGGGATIARMASLWAGIPDTAAVMTVNRQCSSGLQACASIVAAIQTGVIEVGIGAGMESMTQHYGPGAMPAAVSEAVMSCGQAQDCLLPMGITSENVATAHNISRAEQDAFAADSHKKATAAQQNGWFGAEIVPITVKDEAGNNVTIAADDGIRKGVSAEALNKLKPAFKEDGSTTAGNASQVSDGAAAVLLMKRKKAKELGLPIQGKWVSFAVTGVPPNVMGVGPAFAIPLALKKAGISVNDVDIYEINEAFASQAVFSVKHLGIPMNKVNPKGGAIALGHPLGCTGARQISTLLTELKRQGKRIGVTSMCIGTGMGAAAVFVA